MLPKSSTWDQHNHAGRSLNPGKPYLRRYASFRYRNWFNKVLLGLHFRGMFSERPLVLASRRRFSVAGLAAIVLLLLLAATAIGGIWFYRDRKWLQRSSPERWIIAVRFDRYPQRDDLDTCEQVGHLALKALHKEYPSRLRYERPVHGWQTWPDYGYTQLVLYRDVPGPLIDPEVLLQHCITSLHGLKGEWRVAVYDDEGRLAGPVRCRQH